MKILSCARLIYVSFPTTINTDPLIWRSVCREPEVELLAQYGQGTSLNALLPWSLMMPNKSLRILIADEHPMQLLQLEKMLNGMGYFRIAPVESFEDLQRLVLSALQPFNLLVGNIDLASHAGVDLERFCRVNQQIQHALLYQSQHLKVPAIPNAQREAVKVSLPKVPDNETMQSFMSIIDMPKVIGQLPDVSRRGGRMDYPGRRMSFPPTVFSR